MIKVDRQEGKVLHVAGILEKQICPTEWPLNIVKSVLHDNGKLCIENSWRQLLHSTTSPVSFSLFDIR